MKSITITLVLLLLTNGLFSQKPVFDEICSIITAWDSIAPSQGLKVACYGFDNSLDI